MLGKNRHTPRGSMTWAPAAIRGSTDPATDTASLPQAGIGYEPEFLLTIHARAREATVRGLSVVEPFAQVSRRIRTFRLPVQSRPTARMNLIRKLPLHVVQSCPPYPHPDKGRSPRRAARSLGRKRPRRAGTGRPGSCQALLWSVLRPAAHPWHTRRQRLSAVHRHRTQSLTH